MKNFGATNSSIGPSVILTEYSIRSGQMTIHLHPKELSLILALRNKFSFGDVTITMREGIPQYVKRVVEIDNLDAVT